MLLVGEGFAEENFLKHLKALYSERGQKSITIKNAKGKGGRAVLEYARRQRRVAEYDHVATLLDTDTDWTDVQRKQARESAIEVFESSPCFEAWLLNVAGRVPPHETSQCKRDFERAFGAPAHIDGVFTRHFGIDVLEAARQKSPVLESIIKCIQRDK